MNVYIFHRAEGFYPLSLRDDLDAITNAELNPGTLRVEEAATGRLVWLKTKLSLADTAKEVGRG